MDDLPEGLLLEQGSGTPSSSSRGRRVGARDLLKFLVGLKTGVTLSGAYRHDTG